MRWKATRLAAAAGVLAAFGGAAVAQEAPAADAIALPGWMAGCWIAGGEGSRTEECWTVPRGEMMLGSGHSFADDDTRNFEHMRIVRDGGSLVFIAQPGGAPPTRFVLQATKIGPELRDGLLFVNVENDYPQRVQYWRDGADLMAEISRIDGSNPMRWRFRRPGGG